MLIKEIIEDLNFLEKKFNVSKVAAILSNRGFHALFIYRVSNCLFKYKIPIIPLVLTRLVHIFYSIDIDFKCKIHGGVIIIHGVGLVIGQGVVINEGVIIYHCVTLGRKYQMSEKHINDGFPYIQRNCVLGAGAKIIGNVVIGESSIIGVNVVLTKNIEAGSIVKVMPPNVFVKEKLL